MAGLRHSVDVMSGRFSGLALTLATTAGLLGLAAPATPATALSNALHCESSAEVAGRTPILLVHGFRSSVDTWTLETKRYLAKDSQSYCIATFDYGPHSSEWVTNAEISAPLARRLVDITSEASGGKAVVVAHSMGGLALRCALDESCSGVAGATATVAAVVTLGTPNQGSYLRSREINLLKGVICGAGRSTPAASEVCDAIDAAAESPAGRAFRPDSPELKELPALPSDIPVLALAGSVSLQTSWWGRAPRALGSAGDIVVGEASAVAGHRSIGSIGGEKVLSCGVLDLSFSVFVTPACWHSSETRDPSFLAATLNVLSRLKHQQPGAGVQLGATSRQVVTIFVDDPLGSGENVISVVDLATGTEITRRSWTWDSLTQPFDTDLGQLHWRPASQADQCGLGGGPHCDSIFTPDFSAIIGTVAVPNGRIVPAEVTISSTPELRLLAPPEQLTAFAARAQGYIPLLRYLPDGRLTWVEVVPSKDEKVVTVHIGSRAYQTRGELRAASEDSLWDLAVKGDEWLLRIDGFGDIVYLNGQGLTPDAEFPPHVDQRELLDPLLPPTQYDLQGPAVRVGDQWAFLAAPPDSKVPGLFLFGEGDNEPTAVNPVVPDGFLLYGGPWPR